MNCIRRGYSATQHLRNRQHRLEDLSKTESIPKSISPVGHHLKVEANVQELPESRPKQETPQSLLDRLKRIQIDSAKVSEKKFIGLGPSTELYNPKHNSQMDANRMLTTRDDGKEAKDSTKESPVFSVKDLRSMDG